MLPERRPACRWREAQPGSCTERENLAGDAKGKGASGNHREDRSAKQSEWRHRCQNVASWGQSRSQSERRGLPGYCVLSNLTKERNKWTISKKPMPRPGSMLWH